MENKQMATESIDEVYIQEWLSQSEIFKILDEKMLFFALHENQFVYVNACFKENTGYVKNELIGKNIDDIIKDGFKRIRKERDSNYYKVKVYKKDGQSIWLDACIKNLKVKEKEIMLVVACNGTEYMEMKERLKMQEEEYADILNTQTEIIVRSTMDHKYIFVNDAYCRFFGIEKGKIPQGNTFSCVYKEDYLKVKNLLNSLTKENSLLQSEFRVIKADGTLVWTEWIGRVFYDQKGEAIAYQAIGRDITKRKKAQDALKKLQDELEITIEKRTEELHKANKELTMVNSYMNSILMNMSEGVAVIDELGNFKNLNRKLDKEWSSHVVKEIETYLKDIVLKKKNNDIHKMLKEKKSFYGSELTIPTTKGNLQFFISGDPIEDKEDVVNKGVIVYRPIAEVRDLVNRFSGAQARFKFRDIITKNKRMIKTVQIATRAALGDGNILIQGESGTGKELFAQAIHNHSNRCKGPFVAVNCGAIPRDLLGSELFGYVEGAFTGAKKGGKPGKFELASGGTLFLDEIGDMPYEQQVALLRVIQEKRIVRIGGSEVIPIDVRIICATNKKLYEAIKDGSFREDLYYRLNVISIHIPPLRKRREDILLLLEYFIKKTDRSWDGFVKHIDPLALEYLKKYNWHGNVRELENVVERLAHIVQDEIITIDYLPENIIKTYAKELGKETISVEKEAFTIKDIIEKERMRKEIKESDDILKLLRACNGNISKTAKLMGISRSTFYRKMKKYKIEEKL
ncbi:MAG: sigma 54-interacting transcriptional regulator [Marinisporobacter sp.]|nr:sigma 54-interacting transcriptional regulator [Marinisporobacter sp.]